MVTESLFKIIQQLEAFLIEHGFSKKGKVDFIRKIKNDFGREEKLSFSARANRADPNSIYVSCIIGIYYKDVRKVEKQIVDDFILKYPIVAGSISHYSQKNEFLSIPYTAGINDDIVVKEIKTEITNGAFKLLENFPNLDSILKGIENENPIFSDYYKVYNERALLTVVAIIYCLKGKEAAITWAGKKFKKDSKILKDVESVWK